MCWNCGVPGGSLAGFCKGNVKGPVADWRTVNRGTGIVRSQGLSRAIQRYQRPDEIESGGPILQEAWEIMHTAVEPGFTRGSIIAGIRKSG